MLSCLFSGFVVAARQSSGQDHRAGSRPVPASMKKEVENRGYSTTTRLLELLLLLLELLPGTDKPLRGFSEQCGTTALVVLLLLFLVGSEGEKKKCQVQGQGQLYRDSTTSPATSPHDYLYIRSYAYRKRWSFNDNSMTAEKKKKNQFNKNRKKKKKTTKLRGMLILCSRSCRGLKFS